MISPPASTDAVVSFLDTQDEAVDIMVVRGAGYRPAGDLVTCDLSAASADLLVDELHRLGVTAAGSVSLADAPDVLDEDPYDDRVHDPRGDDAVVWPRVLADLGRHARFSGTFALLSIVATVIAAIGVITDSPVLIVGAMVVGPDFPVIAAVCLGLVLGHHRLALRALATLLGGFVLGIAWVYAGTLLGQVLGIVEDPLHIAARTATLFTSDPGSLGMLVAVFAGAAGMVSVTSERPGVLIGVLISVTTVPASATIAVAAVAGDMAVTLGATATLGANLAGILVAGIVTLLVQRLLTRRSVRRDQAELTV